MRQRAMIAIALACQPSLLLADEPTTALDATVQIQVLILLRKLQREFGMGLVFVTHDLSVAAQIADRVAVMYAGRIVEVGSAREVLLNPRHPYTIGMLARHCTAVCAAAISTAIPGSPPDMRSLPPGCSFAPRCRLRWPNVSRDAGAGSALAGPQRSLSPRRPISRRALAS